MQKENNKLKTKTIKIKLLSIQILELPYINFKITMINKLNKFNELEKFIRELKTIKGKQIDILKLKRIIMKLRSKQNGLRAEVRVSKLECRSFKNSQIEALRDKRMEYIETSLRDRQDMVNTFNCMSYGIPSGKDRKDKAKAIQKR